MQVTDDPQDVQFVVATSWNCDNSDFARGEYFLDRLVAHLGTDNSLTFSSPQTTCTVTQNPQVRLMKPTWLDRWGLEGNGGLSLFARFGRG